MNTLNYLHYNIDYVVLVVISFISGCVFHDGLNMRRCRIAVIDNRRGYLLDENGNVIDNINNILIPYDSRQCKLPHKQSIAENSRYR